MSSSFKTHPLEELISSFDWRQIEANEASLIRSLAIALEVSELDFVRWQDGDRPVPVGQDPFALTVEELSLMSSEDVRSYMAFLVRYMALAYKGTVLWVRDRNHNPPGTPAHVVASLRALRP